jgi:hypothetical protein
MPDMIVTGLVVLVGLVGWWWVSLAERNECRPGFEVLPPTGREDSGHGSN